MKILNCAQPLIARFRIVCAAILGILFVQALAGGVVAADPSCPSPYTWSTTFNTCVAPTTNGKCPDGGKPVFICSYDPTTGASSSAPPADSGSGSGGGAGSNNALTGGGKDFSDVPDDPALTGGNCASVSHCDLFDKYINPFIKFMSAAFGVGVVMSLIIAGIQYGSSGGDPQKAAAAKNRIRNSIIALLVFLFLLSILNFLVPGGIV